MKSFTKIALAAVIACSFTSSAMALDTIVTTPGNYTTEYYVTVPADDKKEEVKTLPAKNPKEVCDQLKTCIDKGKTYKLVLSGKCSTNDENKNKADGKATIEVYLDGKHIATITADMVGIDLTTQLPAQVISQIQKAFKDKGAKCSKESSGKIIGGVGNEWPLNVDDKGIIVNPVKVVPKK